VTHREQEEEERRSTHSTGTSFSSLLAKRLSVRCDASSLSASKRTHAAPCKILPPLPPKPHLADSPRAITSHNGKGAAPKNSLEHGVVYTGPYPPRPVANEGKMLTIPIRIDPSEKFGTLHPASRVDYAKTYNIEHNVKVRPFGMVNSQSMNPLIRQWAQILMRRFSPAQTAFRAVSPATLRDLGFTTDMIRAVLVMMTPRSKGPVADARTSITSVARNSAKEELKAEEEEDASTKEKLANVAKAEKLANQVVELIEAGMPYNLAIDHVRQLSENGNGYKGEDDAVGEGDDEDDDDEDEDEEEEEGDEASSSSSEEEEEEESDEE
jgi:hypothetical protein